MTANQAASQENFYPYDRSKFVTPQSMSATPKIECNSVVEPVPADIWAQINRLKQFVTFEDDADKKLAAKNFAPQILPLLTETLDRLKKIFPADTEYSLSESPDPSDRGFVLDVWAHGDCKKIMTDLRKFDEEWWIDNMPEPADILIVEVHRR